MVKIPDQQLKEILVKEKLITGEDFDSILVIAKRMGQQVADILVSRNYIQFDYYKQLVGRYFGVPLASLVHQSIDEAAVRLLSEDIARQKRIIIFKKDPDGALHVAMNDPTDLAAIEFLNSRFKAKIIPYLGSADDIDKGFEIYGRRSAEDFKTSIQENIQASIRAQIFGKAEKEAAAEVPIVAIVNSLISYALASRASDIHLEILEESILVRYRVDGVLHEVLRLPKEVHAPIVARVKLLGALRLDEHAKPQDGRFRYQAGGEPLDIRVAVIPTFYGEKVEMRLLLATNRALAFEEIGMLEDTIRSVKGNIAKTYGIVLVTGPTGSGKSTTLYAMVNVLNKPEVNICTIEDPVEYDMKYINQTQVNTAAGITFASGLRALLRQDPNIIMVGEIRDSETADIAVQAALTGHLVISSLHTNDAPSAIPRLFDMKVEPFLAAAVLNLVMAQRLVRKICPECVKPHDISPEIVVAIKNQLKLVGADADKLPKKLFKGKGCQSCGFIGFKGRMAIFEAFEVNEEMRGIIVDPHFTLDNLKKALRKNGMISMFEDGLRKAEKGMTTIEEVLRVIRE